MGGSGKWLKSLIPMSKPNKNDDQDKMGDKGKKRWKLWRSSSEGFESSVKEGKGGVRVASEAPDSLFMADKAFAAAMATMIRAPHKDFVVVKKEWAAIRIQTAFRALLARKALRALKAVVRIQAIFRGQQVRKQAAVTLRCMQALVRVQTRIRAQNVQTSLEGQAVQQILDEHRKQADLLSQSQQGGWCASPGTFDDIKAKIQMRQEGALKRERVIAYSLSQQMRSNSSPSTNTKKSMGSPYRRNLDKSNSGMSWLECWMAVKAWDNGLLEDTDTIPSEIVQLSRKSEDNTCSFPSHSCEYDTVKVRKNNVTTRISAKSPTLHQVIHSSSEPSSESLYNESSPSTSYTFASPMYCNSPMVGRIAESQTRQPSYMNDTKSAKAKQRAFKYFPRTNRRQMEDLHYTKSMPLSTGETRFSSDSDPSIDLYKDLYPPLAVPRHKWLRNGRH